MRHAMRRTTASSSCRSEAAVIVCPRGAHPRAFERTVFTRMVRRDTRKCLTALIVILLLATEMESKCGG